MGVERITFDTNILYYALDIEGGEKHLVAADLLRAAVRADSVLLLQSLAELYNAARKRKTISLDVVEDFIADNINVSPVVAFERTDLLPAIALQRSHRLQFWDAVLITTAVRAGCTIMLSEDGQHDRVFDGLTVINPFLPGFDMQHLLT
jgi:predicted nucleic acid-binding protein